MITFSIIQKSQLEGSHRIDAEYFQSEYLEVEKKLSGIATKRIDEISDSLVNFGAYSLCNYIVWQDSGIPYLNVENIKEGYIDFDNLKFIDEKVNEILKKSKVKEGQIILPMAGTIGNAAIAYKVPYKINSNQATAKITLKSGTSPFYVAAFLNSHYGKSQTRREILSSVQPNIFLWQIKKFKVPIVSKQRQEEIGDVWKSGLDELDNSKIYYQHAEGLILEELGLNNFQVEDDLSFVVNLSDVKNVNRIDAEHFQPKYQELIGEIEKYKGGFDLVSNQFKQNKSLSKKDKDYYNYIEISDVNVSNGEIIPNRLAKKEIPANGKVTLCQNDLLISKVRPYRGAVSFIDFEVKDLLGSGAFTVLQEKTTYKKEVLMIFLKLDFIKDLLLRYNCGTSYPVIKDEDIMNLKIPLIRPDIQEEIAGLIKKSHEARKKSKELLEEAKRKVEEMIEKGGRFNG